MTWHMILIQKHFSHWMRYLQIFIHFVMMFAKCYIRGGRLQWLFDIITLSYRYVQLIEIPTALLKHFLLQKETVWTFQAFECIWMLYNRQIETFLFQAHYDKLFILPKLKIQVFAFLAKCLSLTLFYYNIYCNKWVKHIKEIKMIKSESNAW